MRSYRWSAEEKSRPLPPPLPPDCPLHPGLAEIDGPPPLSEHAVRGRVRRWIIVLYKKHFESFLHPYAANPQYCRSAALLLAFPLSHSLSPSLSLLCHYGAARNAVYSRVNN
ncbi:hypothetical protein J6590_061873 [Homalodisca vitripennis]|nr:hypothetical protein J6590_061873 [Homalodisca vitripennis]